MQSLATTKIDEIGTAVDDLEMSKIIKIEVYNSSLEKIEEITAGAQPEIRSHLHHFRL